MTRVLALLAALFCCACGDAPFKPSKAEPVPKPTTSIHVPLPDCHAGAPC